jgi:hypothetical protein
MTRLDDAMQERMAYLVFIEHRAFSYLDFLSFEVDGVEYNMSHGTFRNKISKLINTGGVELVCNSGLGFYSLKGIKLQKKLITGNHMGVSSRDPIYRMIQDLRIGKNALHDIRLRFELKGLWSALSANNSQLAINPISKDIRLQSWKINDLLIKGTVHRTDTVTIIIGCSYTPIAVDINGIIRLSNALTRIEERLSRLIADCGTVTKIGGRVGCESLLPVPEHNGWIVTMWHFGADASIEYSGDKFSCTWEAGQNALVRVYTKEMRDRKTRIRLERQEYPDKTFADAIEEKLQFNGAGGDSNSY